MTDLTLSIHPADQAGDLDRLRAYAARQGAEHQLDRHLAQPRSRHTLARLAERAGAIAGFALIAHRRLRLGAARLEVGSIMALQLGDPSDAELRAALLGDCLGALMDEGLPIVTLTGMAAELGPFGLAAYCLQSTVDLAAGAAGAAPALRAVTPGDLDDLGALYDASYAGLALCDDRAAPDWRAWIEHHDALALEDSRGRVVAYAAPADGLPGAPLAIGEAAAADAGAARLLCAALADRAGAIGGKLHLHLAPWHPVAQAALHIGGAARLSAPLAAAPAPLAGVVDLLGALEALAPELERRLARSRYAGWNGSLRIELADERFTLAFDQGRATVIDGQRPADLRLRQVTLPGLAQLCLGYRAAADLRATGDLACDDAALGLIDALFPTVLAAA